MATIPVPNVVQLELIYTFNSDVMENVLHYQIPGTANADDLTALAAAAYTEWVTNLRASISQSVFLRSIKVTDLTTNVSPTVTWGVGLPQAGSLVGTPAPNNVTCCFTKRTNLRGRNNRGRIYWPLLATSEITNNVLSGARVTAIVNGLANFRVLNTALGDWEMVVVSRYFNNSPRASGIFTPVTNFTSDGIVDSQRRRLPGRGA